MADVCDFLYTQGGLRFQSGSARVSVVIDGVTHDLKVIRNGKGRSRIERGEINLRDLALHVAQGESIDATVLLDGVEVPITIDPRTAMGRGGRIKAYELDAETGHLSPDKKVALARSQIKSLPYSHANSNEAKVRLDWALEQGDLGVFDIEELRLVAGFLDPVWIDITAQKQPGLILGLWEHTTGDAIDPELLSVLPQEVRETIHESYFRDNLASWTDTPLSVLDFLAKDPDATVRESLAGNQSASATILESLAKDQDADVRESLAGNQSASATILESLAKDPEYEVREALAGNQSASATIMESLAKDPEDEVREALAGNQSASATTLESLAKDPNVEVRKTVAVNSSTPSHVQEILLNDSDRQVREIVAQRQRFATAFDVLSKDSDYRVRETVAVNPNTPIVILEALANDQSYIVRGAIATNPSTPIVILEALALDEDQYVSELASESLIYRT